MKSLLLYGEILRRTHPVIGAASEVANPSPALVVLGPKSSPHSQGTALQYAWVSIHDVTKPVHERQPAQVGPILRSIELDDTSNPHGSFTSLRNYTTRSSGTPRSSPHDMTTPVPALYPALYLPSRSQYQTSPL